MSCMSLSELYRHNFTVSDIIVLPQYWQNGKVFTYGKASKLRPDNGLMLFVNGSVSYTGESTEALGEAGARDMVYAPKGGCYRATFHTGNISDENAEAGNELTNYLINFNLYNEDGEPLTLCETGDVRIFPCDSSFLSYHELENRFKEMLDCSRNAAFPPAKLKAMLYNLLCDISQGLHEKRFPSPESGQIKPAIDYISANYLSGELKISSLARMCCMSEVNFRRVFTKHCGVSPKAYILKLKLDCAATLLKRGDFSVAQVARYVGFDDASYFVRIYRKHMGNSPGRERKQ